MLHSCATYYKIVKIKLQLIIIQQMKQLNCPMQMEHSPLPYAPF